MNETPWNANALARRRWIMERLTETAAHGDLQPTATQLAAESGVSINTVHCDMKWLERRRYIERGPFGSSRTIRVLVPFLTGQVEITARKADAA